jgi:NAD+ kinase
MFTPHNLAVMYHPQVANAGEEAQLLADALQEQGLQVLVASLYDANLREQVRTNGFDLLIALGGDGTLLRAGHLCAPLGIPILGINLGRFGFLTEIHSREWEQMLPRLFAGDFWLENRMMLQCEHVHSGSVFGNWDVLNEVFVGRGESVRPVHLQTHVDGRHLTTYVADGLIAATPTGSTAYALAAGGPILPPELRNMLLVAVAPHQPVLSVDGQPPIRLDNGDAVNVHASDHTCNFIRFQDPGYFYRNLTPHMSQNPVTGNSR